MISNEALEKEIQGRKIDLNTVVSTTEKKCTLMQWLQAVERALNKGTLENVEILQPTKRQIQFKLTFKDLTSVVSNVIDLPADMTGIVDAADLIKLLEGDETIVVDLTQDGQRVEIHLDQLFKETLATKAMLASKVNVDTVYSNDEPAFSDAMERVSNKDDFYSYFYNLRKEPSNTYLIQGQEGVSFDNIKNALSMPDTKGQKWALLCECVSSEAGGFFIKLSLTNANHSILYTNIIGGWLNGSIVGTWKNEQESGGGIQPATEKNIVYATDAQGHQTTLQYNKTAVGGGLAQRNNDGTLEVATPTRDNDAATKEYVDSHSGGSKLYKHNININGTIYFDFISNTNIAITNYLSFLENAINNRKNDSVFIPLFFYNDDSGGVNVLIPKIIESSIIIEPYYDTSTGIMDNTSYTDLSTISWSGAIDTVTEL